MFATWLLWQNNLLYKGSLVVSESVGPANAVNNRIYGAVRHNLISVGPADGGRASTSNSSTNTESVGPASVSNTRSASYIRVNVEAVGPPVVVVTAEVIKPTPPTPPTPPSFENDPTSLGAVFAIVPSAIHRKTYRFIEIEFIFKNTRTLKEFYTEKDINISVKDLHSIPTIRKKATVTLSRIDRQNGSLWKK